MLPLLNVNSIGVRDFSFLLNIINEYSWEMSINKHPVTDALRKDSDSHHNSPKVTFFVQYIYAKGMKTGQRWQVTALLYSADLPLSHPWST